jgi:hypothetical protein
MPRTEINKFTANSWIWDTMIHQHSDSADRWLFASGQPIRVVATWPLVMRTWATRKDRNPIHLTENLNWTPNLGKICRIWETWFYINRGTTLWTVALKRPIFKQKKGVANLNLGLLLYSEALSQPWSRDTVPLREHGPLTREWNKLADFIVNML